MNDLIRINFTSNLGWQIALVALWLGGLLIIAETINRLTNLSPEITRKIVHIGTGNVILFAWLLNIPAWVGICSAIVASIIALLSYYLPILPGVNGVGRQSYGTFFYAVSIGVLIAWFWPLKHPYFAAIGILIMTYGDGLAALFGQHFGKRKYQFLGNKKSIEGSLVMALIAYLISALILISVYGNIGVVWLIALAVAISATGLETLSNYGIDNFTVPVGSAAIAYFLCHLLIAKN